MVKEAILAGVNISEIVGESAVIETLPCSSAEIIETTKEVFECLTETKTPQGVLAVIPLPENKKEKPAGNCVVLDGVADPGNLGTIIRTCAALNIKDLYLCNCADAFSPKVIRSSMSGIFSVDLHFFDRETTFELVKGNTVCCADMNGENLFFSNIKEPYAIVIGNEANGVSEYFKQKSERIISIPMSDKIESLNAAVSFAVIAYTLQGKKL